MFPESSLVVQMRVGFGDFLVSMPAPDEQRVPFRARDESRRGTRSLRQSLALALGLAALIYAFLGGLRTVSDFDLGWQLATGRWIVEHHRIPSTEVFSYTAQGQPWIYPVGSGLLFYGVYVLGGWVLLSWLGAVVCAGTVGTMLRRGSMMTAVLAIIAVPRIAQHTVPRADMFTLLLFAVFLVLLWRQHEGGGARLWLLPVLMAAWVNLHLGFIAGLALLGAYVGTEILEMLWPERRDAAMHRLRRAAPYLVATVAATLVNPWGWGIYRALLRQNAAMAQHSKWIIEWAPTNLNWPLLSEAWSLRNPAGAYPMLLVIAMVALISALVQRRLGAATLLSAAAWMSIRHVRFQALFAVVVVVVGGAVLSSVAGRIKNHATDVRLRQLLAFAAAVLVVSVVFLRSYDLVTDRAYLGTTELSTFGGGLSWWFPESAAAFVERENIPGQVFNTYDEGGYLVWRLGEKYRDYIDGRAIPFGSELFQRSGGLFIAPPDSADWQTEAERYNIDAIIAPLGRYNALQFFPTLRQFCSSERWRPVYLDEFSAVFVRRTPQTEPLIKRWQVDCATAPLPARPVADKGSTAFNRWANAAAILKELGRNAEAFDATTKALSIFPDSAFVHFLRGNLLAEAGNLQGAEQQYLTAAELEGNAATWSALADLYHVEHRPAPEISAWEQAVERLPRPGLALLSLGYACLDAGRASDALHALDRAEKSMDSESPTDTSFAANLAHGRSLAWNALGNLNKAVSFEEETVRLSPDRADDWLQLAQLYERQGRFADAQRARERATGR
jgi:Flp pilus assembly protein TadD